MIIMSGVTVTVHGRPSAVLLATDDLERLEETLAILRDSDTVNRLAASDANWHGAKKSRRRNWQRPCATALPRVTEQAPDGPSTLRTTPTVRRALTETLETESDGLSPLCTRRTSSAAALVVP